MAQNGVPLLVSTGVELITENGFTIYVSDLPFVDGNSGHGGNKGKAKGKDRELWEFYALELAQKMPKKAKEPEPEPVEAEMDAEPAPIGGFFSEPTSPEMVLAQLRARVQAQELQKQRNAKSLSDLLRKLSRR